MPSTRARTWAERTACKRPGRSCVIVALPAATVMTSTSAGGWCSRGSGGGSGRPFLVALAARGKQAQQNQGRYFLHLMLRNNNAIAFWMAVIAYGKRFLRFSRTHRGGIEEMSLDTHRATAKQRDQLAILVRHLDIVDTAAPALLTLFPHSRQHVAEKCRGEKIDIHPTRHGTVVVRIAGIAEGRIGDGKDKSTMAGTMTIHHVLPAPACAGWPIRGRRQQFPCRVHGRHDRPAT